MLPTFYKTTAKKIHSIFNLESFFDFFWGCIAKVVSKTLHANMKKYFADQKIIKADEKKKYYEHYAFAFSFPYITTTTQQHIVLL